MVGESQETLVGAGAGTGPGSNKTPTLEEYGTNLTTQANEVGPGNQLQDLFWLVCCIERPLVLDQAGLLGLQGKLCMPAAGLVWPALLGRVAGN